LQFIRIAIKKARGVWDGRPGAQKYEVGANLESSCTTGCGKSSVTQSEKGLSLQRFTTEHLETWAKKRNGLGDVYRTTVKMKEQFREKISGRATSEPYAFDATTKKNANSRGP